MRTQITKADLLSHAQTVALAGCGKWPCLKERPNRPPELCRECALLVFRLTLKAAYWKRQTS